MEAWIREFVKQKQIPNCSMLTAQKELESDEILLSDYDLICINNNTKEYRIFRILRGGGSTLFGNHEIKMKGKKFVVYNLTSLKRNFFLFDDKLTFERSTYLIHPKLKKLYRLKGIRDLIKIPPLAFGTKADVFFGPDVYVSMILKEKLQKPLDAEKFRNRMEFAVEDIVRLYRRSNPFASMEDTCAHFGYGVGRYIEEYTSVFGMQQGINLQLKMIKQEVQTIKEEADDNSLSG